MARPKRLFTKQDAEQAALERETFKDWHIVNRLSAVIAYATHPAKEVAKIFDVTTVTVLKWAHAFHTKGVNGLCDAGKGHRPKKLSGQNAEVVRNWVIASKNAQGKRVHWTLKRLCIEIKTELGIELACSSLSETLAEMRLVIKRPRPMNYRYDLKKAEDFKKMLCSTYCMIITTILPKHATIAEYGKITIKQFESLNKVETGDTLETDKVQFTTISL